jgi:hypothetical protein
LRLHYEKLCLADADFGNTQVEVGLPLALNQGGNLVQHNLPRIYGLLRNRELRHFLAGSFAVR